MSHGPSGLGGVLPAPLLAWPATSSVATGSMSASVSKIKRLLRVFILSPFKKIFMFNTQ